MTENDVYQWYVNSARVNRVTPGGVKNGKFVTLTHLKKSA
jgi:hypothetical protein